MFNKILQFFLFLLLCLHVTSCSLGGSPDWTVMIWLDGDNNLESYALADLNELEYGLYVASLSDPGITSRVRIIVQVDRNSGYDNSAMYTGTNWTGTRRYLIRPDALNRIVWTSERIDDNMGEINMGDAGALRDFIEYCHRCYPAQKYSLILWNHGGGLMKKAFSSADCTTAVTSDVPLKEICIDETDGDDALYTGEITDALTDEHSVDFLGFDACLMGMIEVAWEYRPGVPGKFGADAICFSPASEQGDGWDYVRILTRLGGTDSGPDTPDAENDECYNTWSLTANQFAEICAREYGDADSIYANDLQTQTAVDNTLVGDVKNAMDAFAAAISDAGGYLSVLEGIRGSGSSVAAMHYFTETSSSQWLSWPYFDLYDFALRVRAQNMSVAVNDAADDLMDAVSGFILYSYGGSDYRGYTSGAADSTGTTAFRNGKNGLSFFFTSDSSDLDDQWWYTSLDTDSVQSGNYYGRLDFCEKGPVDGLVENWYELIMEMYMTSGLLNTGFWPDPAY